MPNTTDALSPSVRAVLDEAQATLQRIYGSRLQRLILFGSHARGGARPESDVDLLVVLEGPVDILEEARRTSGVAMRAAAEHDVALSFLHLSDEEFADRRRPLVRSIRKEGIDLVAPGSEASIPREEPSE